MSVTPWQAYLTMFDALDAACDEKPTERLRSFLSEANPFLWEGIGSADPAVFSRFGSAFNEAFGDGGAKPEEALEFARTYLAEQNEVYRWANGNLTDSFDSIVTPELWVQALEDNKQ